jgi:hypothetical protein
MSHYKYPTDLVFHPSTYSFSLKRRSEVEMMVADRGSRGTWSKNMEFSMDFTTMASLLQDYVFTIYAFATRSNAIVGRYYSRAFEVEALGQDFFEQECGQKEFLWCNPSARIFPAMLRTLAEERASGVGVFHMDTSQPYFSSFVKGNHFLSFVRGFRRVRPLFVVNETGETF